MSAQLVDPAIDPGESTQYQIVVTNGQADQAPPPAPIIAGLQFRYAGQGDTMQMKGGFSGFTTVRSRVYAYTVTGVKPGQYVIPGQQVVVNGSELRTNPVTLTVQDDGSNGQTPPGQTVTLDLLVPKKSAYVGESIPVEVRASFGEAVRARPDANCTLTGEGFSVGKFTQPTGRTVEVDGSSYNTFSYKAAIAGLKLGKLSIGPAEVEAVVQMPLKRSQRRRNSRNPFGQNFDPFGGDPFGMNLLSQPQQIKLRSEPVTLDVLPLPPDKPADFSGGIGQFHLEAEIDQRRAQAGDPVTVRLVLSGQGNFDRINAPEIVNEQGLKTYPAKSKFKADDEVGLSGIKTFEQTLVADGPRTTLPPYRLSYLDPATGKYVTLETAPLAVRIEGAAATPAPGQGLAQQSALSTAPAATPTPTPMPPSEDILYIRNDPGTARDRAAFLPLYVRRGFWLAQAVPLAALLAALSGFGLRARVRNEAARRRALQGREQSALQRTLRDGNVGRREFYSAATRLAQLRTEQRGPVGNGAGATEVARTHGLDPQATDALQEVFGRKDELAYSGGQVALEPVTEQERSRVLAVLQTLERTDR